jgi:uncharacterized protein
MMQNELHKKIIKIVEKKLTCSAHDLEHVFRVYKLCIDLSKYEPNVDMDILIPSALLHDIARVEENNDTTGQIDHSILGSELAEKILEDLGYENEKIEKIKHCIVTHRFRTDNKPKSIEAKILFDADKLDSIGAVGIARAFMLGGQFGQKISVELPNQDELNENSSKNGRLKEMSKHTSFIEYELKLKKIPDKLYTYKAKEIGARRINIMESYFHDLKLELTGIY